jgi:hypothetical protein
LPHWLRLGSGSFGGLINAIPPAFPPLGDAVGDVLADAEAEVEPDADVDPEGEVVVVAAAWPGLPNELTGNSTTIKKNAPNRARTIRASARPSFPDKDDRFKLYLLASRLNEAPDSLYLSIYLNDEALSRLPRPQQDTVGQPDPYRPFLLASSRIANKCL